MSSSQYRIALINFLLKPAAMFIGQFDFDKKLSNDFRCKKIIIISNKRLGDFMFCTPAIGAVRDRYPGAHITLVTNKMNARLATPGTWFDDVVIMENALQSMMQAVSKLRKSKPELAIILHSRAPYDVVCSVLCGCKYIIKDYYSNEPQGMDRWLSAVTRGRGKHIIARKMELVSALGCDIRNPAMFIPFKVNKSSTKTHKRVIGLQMGASTPIKCWPGENFLHLAVKLLDNFADIEIYLVGVNSEQHLADMLLAGLGDEYKQRVVNYVGKTDIHQLVAAVLDMAVLVTGDTGTLHLAVAANIKTISLYSATDPKENGPYQDAHLHKVIYRPHVANQAGTGLGNIGIDEVYKHLIEALDGAV